MTVSPPAPVRLRPALPRRVPDDEDGVQVWSPFLDGLHEIPRGQRLGHVELDVTHTHGEERTEGGVHGEVAHDDAVDDTAAQRLLVLSMSARHEPHFIRSSTVNNLSGALEVRVSDGVEATPEEGHLGLALRAVPSADLRRGPLGPIIAASMSRHAGAGRGAPPRVGDRGEGGGVRRPRRAGCSIHGGRRHCTRALQGVSGPARSVLPRPRRHGVLRLAPRGGRALFHLLRGEGRLPESDRRRATCGRVPKGPPGAEAQARGCQRTADQGGCRAALKRARPNAQHHAGARRPQNGIGGGAGLGGPCHVMPVVRWRCRPRRYHASSRAGGRSCGLGAGGRLDGPPGRESRGFVVRPGPPNAYEG